MECSAKDRDCFSSRRRFMAVSASISAFLFFALLCGCSLVGGSRKDSETPPAPVDDYGLQRTTKKLIVKIDNMEFLRQDRKTDPECVICFLGITNAKGDQVPELNEAVKRQFRETTSYRLFSDSEIDEAVKKAEVKRNDIYLPEERKKFVAAADLPLRYFLSGQVFSVPEGTSEPGQPIGDQITFDLVEVKSNEQAIVQDRLASLYNQGSRKKVMGIF